MRRIVLIDKGASSVRSIRKSLERKGAELVCESSLSKAASFLNKTPADLIIIDAAFLESKGSSRFEKLAADTPVLVLAGDGKRKYARSVLKYSELITEPFSMTVFMHAAKRLIGEKELREENRSLRKSLESRDRELGFYESIIETSASADIRKSIGFILEKARKLTGAGACSLLFNDEPLFDIIPLRVSSRINRFNFNSKTGISGWVLEEGKPVLVPDVSRDKRYNRKADSFANQKIRSMMCVPLTIKGRLVGVLRMANKKGGGIFDESDLGLLVNAANYAALTIERTFLYEKLKNDELTNLFNARHMHHVLEMEVERALRYSADFAIIFMDIDNFKKINDRHGHLAGSRALIEIAGLLQDNLRKVDMVARYGGDEFVIILPETPLKGSFQVAERLRKIIEKKVFLKPEGFCIRLTGSFGVAAFPENARTREELLDIADKAMYRGKFSTKNIVFSAS